MGDVCVCDRVGGGRREGEREGGIERHTQRDSHTERDSV